MTTLQCYVIFDIDEDTVIAIGTAKSIEITNQLDVISEKSFTKDDNTEIEQEENKVYFVGLVKADESSL